MDARAIGRGLRAAALQQPGQQRLQGDLLVTERRLPLLHVPGCDLAAHQPEIREQLALDQQYVAQVTRFGRREDLGGALLRTQVIGADHGLQRHALVGTPGRGFADRRRFGVPGLFARAEDHGEAPDAAGHLLGDVTAEVFR